MSEEWRDFPDWEGLYEVSNLGRVRSIKRQHKTLFGMRWHGGKIVKSLRARTGYAVVNLTAVGRKRKQILIHSAVLTAFVCPRPEGKEACHNNGQRMDNRIENLRWDTRKNNHADKLLHGTDQRGERNGGARLTSNVVREIRSSKEPLKDIAKRLNVSEGCVSKAKYRCTWKHVVDLPKQEAA